MELVKTIIGLEVHVELKTNSKMFCSCSADHFDKESNTQTCPTCLGLPGALPVPNKKAIDWTILLGLALEGEIQKNARFDRKNYFYPDLPKGFQISQYDKPFILRGNLKLVSGKNIRIRRVHLEEDTGKLLHETIDGERVTLIDFNRSGVPLVEIVSEPDMNSSDEAKEYLETLQKIVQSLGISSADMEKGMMRCEPTVNLEVSDGKSKFYTPLVEIKNINSFRFVKKAIDFEVDRQFKEFLEIKIEKQKGNKTTRGWDEKKGITFLQRAKEEANDYRYFPEPDIPLIEWSDRDIRNWKLEIGKYELPWDKKKRFISQYGLSEYQARILTQDKKTAGYYEECVRIANGKEVEIANLIINKRAPENLTPEELIKFISTSQTTQEITEEKLDELIKKLLSEHPEAAIGYKNGKVQSLGIIVGLIKGKTGMIIPIERIAKFISMEK